MKVPVKNAETTKTLEVADRLFGSPAAPALLAQAVRTAQANGRLSSAHTKTRGEVRGGGRKPWRQKGTGRARAGSTRSPIWRGGGVIFGPTPDANHTLAMPTRMRHAAFLGALHAAWEDGRVSVISDLTLERPSTKSFLKLLSDAGVELGRTVLVIAQTDEILFRSADNLRELTMTTADRLSVLQILGAARLVITESGLKALDKRYGGQA
jgi:large subunit ribosomal protein L4